MKIKISCEKIGLHSEKDRPVSTGWGHIFEGRPEDNETAQKSVTKAKEQTNKFYSISFQNQLKL